MARKPDWDPGEDFTIRRPAARPYGSSSAFDAGLRDDHPELIVPEHAIVYLGEDDPGWDPGREEPPPGECEYCRGGIPTGSLFVCPRCHRSGFEPQLARQRALAGYPPPERRRPRRSVPVPGPPAESPAAADGAGPPAPLVRWWRDMAWRPGPPPVTLNRSDPLNP